MKPLTTLVSFYCSGCDLDQDLQAYEDGFSTGEQFFEAFCGKCGQKLRRYITDKQTDPYYRKSKKLLRQLKKFANDLIQPGQFGFQTLYKKEWDKIEAAKEALVKKRFDMKTANEKLYDKYKHDVNYRPLVKKLIERDDT